MPALVDPELADIFASLAVPLPASESGLACEDPSRAAILAHVDEDDRERALAKLAAAHECFAALREHPGPQRGELVRRMGDRLRAHKSALARLVCVEVGKGIEEAAGEVQEMIDICDFAVRPRRAQLYGR